jgi:FlaA1/EpsC-like NDP-sugar epimerase
VSLAGKHVVITGAGGSIGSELCKQIAREAYAMTLVSLTESALYRVCKALKGSGPKIYPVLGSVTDFDLMHDAVFGADVVIHAAAHKHVPICEQNPCAAIENNVGGTLNLAHAAVTRGVKQFVLISTDKAVRPASVMGATKRVAERVVRALSGGRTKFLVVRFGNVLDSDGSVLPLWREQIANGGPLTLTDPECQRYFMAIPDAVELILGTLALKPESGTFVLDMGAPQKLGDIAQRLVAHELATASRQIAIEVTGLRAGEKLTEELHHGGELLATSNPKIFRVQDDTQPVDLGELGVLLHSARRKECPFARARLMEMAA